MNKPFTTHYRRLGAALLLLIVAFIVHSCRKELSKQQQNAEIAAAHFPVADAKAWFTTNKIALATKVKINSDASFLNSLADFTPVWDSARTAVDTNYYVVEAPAKYALRFGFAMDSTTANINGLTRLLVLKSKKYGSLNAVLMHIHGNTVVNIGNVHYMAVPAAFSGNIFYTSLQGVFIYGYIFKNGKVIMVSKGGGDAIKPTGPQILQVFVGNEDGCETVETRWSSQTCNWDASDSLIGCTNWTYDFSTYNTYCSSPGGGGGGGGPVPPPPPPKCATGFHFDASSNCVPDSIKKDIIDSIDNKYKCAKTMLADIPNLTDDLSVLLNNTFGANKSYDITFKDAPPSALASPTEDGECKGYHILLNQNVLDNGSGEYILATIYHESLHAFLNSEMATLGRSGFEIKYPDVNVVPTPYIDGMLRYKYMFNEATQVTQVQSDPQHRTMADYFISKMINGILAYNPNFPQDRARALARYGIFVDTSIEYYNDVERDKRKGDSVGKTCNN